MPRNRPRPPRQLRRRNLSSPLRPSTTTSSPGCTVLYSGADIASFQLDLAALIVDSADIFCAMLPDLRSLDQSMLSPE